MKLARTHSTTSKCSTTRNENTSGTACCRRLSSRSSKNPTRGSLRNSGLFNSRKKQLAGFLDGAEEPPPLLQPNLAKYCHEEIAALHGQLGNKKTRTLAADKHRTLVSRIDLVPDRAELVIVLRGDLAAILTLASGKKKPEFRNERAILEDLMGRVDQSSAQKRK